MHLVFIIPLSIIGGFIYLYYRFICTLSRKRGVRFLYLFFLFSIFGLILASFNVRHRGISGFGADFLSWTANISLGLLSFLITLVMLRDFLLILWWAMSGILKGSKLRNPASPERRSFLSGTLTSAIAGSAVSLTGFGVFLAKKQPEVKAVSLPVKNLPDELAGFSIVQLTDIHLSSTCKRDFLETVVATVNSLNPDMVVLTGDLADGVVAVSGKDAEPLCKLHAPFGKYYVTGNHEYYYNAEEWINKVESCGFKALINSNETITVNGKQVLLAGVADYRAGYFIKSHRSDPFKAIQSNTPTDLKILLAHQPKSIFDAAKAGFDIQLSGHTHGGQFYPWQLAIGIDQPYLAGIYQHDDTLLYVSRGTGYWGPPIRMGAPSEITLLKLMAS